MYNVLPISTVIAYDHYTYINTHISYLSMKNCGYSFIQHYIGIMRASRRYERGWHTGCRLQKASHLFGESQNEYKYEIDEDNIKLNP